MFAGSYLFAGIAALALVSAVGAFFAIPEFSHYQSERSGDKTAGELAGLALVLFASLAMAFSCLCVLLAILDGQGRHTARVLTWTLSGLTICFNITLLITGVYDLVPWYRDLIRTAALATVLLATGAITLLALPSSHGYFRAARAARQQQRPRPTPPPGYQPANYPTPPPGYQPPPSLGQQVPPPGYQPQRPSTPANPASPVAPPPSAPQVSLTAPLVEQAPPSAGRETIDPPDDSQ